jgi:hypothetical protein
MIRCADHTRRSHAMTEEELEGLQQSADRLNAASKRIGALTQRLVEERPGHLDVAGHADMRISIQRLTK